VPSDPLMGTIDFGVPRESEVLTSMRVLTEPRRPLVSALSALTNLPKNLFISGRFRRRDKA